jgi:phosphohistidine phosphatase
MDLILWRHADAEDGAPDEARKLTKKGLKQAERMARWLRKRLPDDAVVLVSPARRARETAAALGRRLEVVPDLGTSANPQLVLKTAGWPGRAGAVVVVGHQPTLGQTAALVLTGKEAGWSIKKGGIWWFESRERGELIVRAVIAPDLL